MTLTSFTKQDKELFECLVHLYGFGKASSRPWESTHIVVNQLEFLSQSATINSIKLEQAKNADITMHKIVNSGWLFEVMIKGEKIDE